MARRTYSLDFKEPAAKLVTEQGRGLKDAATGLGVAPSTMQYRVRRSGTPAAARPRALAGEADLRREDDRLRQENERLMMGREIRKKATAFFAGEQA
jgi:transposase-like protein